EGEDALGARGIAVDVEGDAHLKQEALGSMLVAQQVAFRQGLDGLDKQAGMGPRPAIAFEHLVVEAFGAVSRELHTPNSRTLQFPAQDAPGANAIFYDLHSRNRGEADVSSAELARGSLSSGAARLNTSALTA